MLTTLPTGRALRERNKRAEAERVRSAFLTAGLIGITAIFFVLVMIFMTAKSSNDCDLGCGGEVDLVHVTNPRPQRAALREDANFVSVTHDGKVYFGHQQIDPDELPERLRSAIRSGAPSKIFIKADARARYASVKLVIDAARSAGIQDIVFITEKRTSS